MPARRRYPGVIALLGTGSGQLGVTPHRYFPANEFYHEVIETCFNRLVAFATEGQGTPGTVAFE